MHTYSIKVLESNSSISRFQSGDDDLDDFLKTDAVSNIGDWLSLTKVLFVEDIAVGFFTITLDTLHKGRIEISDKIADYPITEFVMP